MRIVVVLTSASFPNSKHPDNAQPVPCAPRTCATASLPTAAQAERRRSRSSAAARLDRAGVSAATSRRTAGRTGGYAPAGAHGDVDGTRDLSGNAARRRAERLRRRRELL